MMRQTNLRTGLRRGDDGVSVVISAVLVFALIMMVLSVYVATIVPDQVKDAEAAHMRRISSSFGDLAHGLTQATALTGGGQFSQQMDLGTTSVPFFAAVESSGQLGISPRAFSAEISCESTRLVARDGAAAPGASFDAASGTFTASEILVLEMRVSSYTFDAGDNTASIAATAESGASLGTFEFRLDDAADAAIVRTLDGATNLVAERVVQVGTGGPPSQIVLLRIDALDPIYGFSGLLEDTQGDRTLTFSTTSAAVEVYAVGRSEEGTLITKGSGRDLGAGFARSVDSASLVYQSRNHRFMDQEYALEGGAVVLSQSTGDYLTVAPFRLETSATANDFLGLTLLNLTGTGDTVGTHRATVSATVRPPLVSIVECTEPRVLVTSEYQGGWAAAWETELRSAGLDTTGLTTSPDFLSVSLSGTWFIEITEAKAQLLVT